MITKLKRISARQYTFCVSRCLNREKPTKKTLTVKHKSVKDNHLLFVLTTTFDFWQSFFVFIPLAAIRPSAGQRDYRLRCIKANLDIRRLNPIFAKAILRIRWILGWRFTVSLQFIYQLEENSSSCNLICILIVCIRARGLRVRPCFLSCPWNSGKWVHDCPIIHESRHFPGKTGLFCPNIPSDRPLFVSAGVLLHNYSGIFLNSVLIGCFGHVDIS